MNGAALHTFVYRNAHGIKDSLGLVSGQNKKKSLMMEENSSHDDGK